MGRAVDGTSNSRKEGTSNRRVDGTSSGWDEQQQGGWDEQQLRCVAEEEVTVGPSKKQMY